MKKKVLAGLIFIVFLLGLVHGVQALDYYAYGDSITSGEGVESYDDVYISWMVATYDPAKTVEHNTDGSGQYSSWGLENFATHPGSPYPKKVYILFGMNDKHYDKTPEFTYLNLAAMYQHYTANGSATTILIEPLAEDGQGDWSTYANQRARILTIQNYLDAQGIPYIKTYDAIDSIPGNCYPDEADSSLMYNSRHPDTVGHRLMGEYIWAGTCTDHATVIAPKAHFTSDVTSGTTPLTVRFTDQSTGTPPLTYTWDFDDGAGSTLKNPFHVYSHAGTYTVRLTVTNTADSDSEVKTDYLTVRYPPPAAGFVVNPTSGTTPLAVQFTDTSVGTGITAWNWNFGDGIWENRTSATSPVHTYTTGTWYPRLTVTNAFGSSTSAITPARTVTVIPPPPSAAGFVVNPTSGTSPLAVQFTDTSVGTGITAWNWSFGDGIWENRTSATSPVHTYTTGTWYPRLTVTDASGSSTSAITPARTIIVLIAPARIGVYQNGMWYLDNDGSGTWNAGDSVYSFGAPGWTPVLGDWNATGYTYFGVTNGQQWYLDWNGNGAFDGVDKAYSFGAPGWTTVTGDWNHDGKTEIGVTNGQQWYLDWNGNGAWDNGVDKAYSFGAPGWTPIVGDWNATGYTYIGVTNGQQWYLDNDGSGTWNAGDKAYIFGAPGWTPIVGDWNGTGKSSLGVTNGQQWYLDWNGNGVWDAGTDKGYNFGASGWKPVVSDWNNDGKTEIGVTNGQQWYLDWNGNGVWDAGTDKTYSFGAPGWTPVVGKWS